MNKLNKKGFTLVELLAVIIILAIVVGITIPAVLTTTSSAKKKAFQTAANTMADWIDRQYQIYQTGLDSTGVATLDPIFKSECFDADYKCDCIENKNGNIRIVLISNAFVTAAGLKAENIRTREDEDKGFVGNSGFNNISFKGDDKNSYSTVTLSPNFSSSNNPTYFHREVYTMVYIDPDTGRSCVKLVAKSGGGDYPELGVACGGVCTSEYKSGGTAKDNIPYCRPRNMD